MVAPQFYIHCFNVNITGTGTVSPPGVTFPGAYGSDTPGLAFDIFINKTTYPIPGPPLYQTNAPGPILEPNQFSRVSPTGDSAKDVEYNKTLKTELEILYNVTSFFNFIGG
jgi:cellulase